MKRLMISTFATIALLAAATTVLQSHSAATRRPSVTAGMPLQDLQKAIDVNKLPVGEFEDLSLVYLTTTKH